MVREYQRKLTTDRRLEYFIDNPKVDFRIARDLKDFEAKGQNLLLVIRVQTYVKWKKTEVLKLKSLIN